MKLSPFSRTSRFSIALFSFGLVFGSTAFAVGAFNTPETGYVLCVNNKTKALTFPGDTKCPKGTKRLTLGAQGIQGIAGEKGDRGESGLIGPKGDIGPSGAAGINGAPGINGVAGAKGTSLLTGVGSPVNSLGENGDTYIDKNSAHIYGPKSSGIWGYPISFAGPAGATGATGPTGAPGPTGPAGPSTEATLRFASDQKDGPVPSSGTLPVYNGTDYTTVLSVTVPSSGSYWASFYTETWADGSQATADNSLCALTKNGSNISYSQNNNKHFIQRLMSNLSAGDVISLKCAQNSGTEGEAYNSSGYILRVSS